MYVTGCVSVVKVFVNVFVYVCLVLVILCVDVCVCVREREREREKGENTLKHLFGAQILVKMLAGFGQMK